MQIDPEGFYLATADSGFLGQDREGFGLFEITWNITQVSDGENWVALPGDEHIIRISRWSFKGDGEKWTMEKLDRVGFNGDYDNPQFSNEQHTIECKHREFKGSMYANWDFPFGGKEARPADDDVKKVLAAKWKNKHSSHSAPAPPSPPA